jgi:hypothetical protein
MEFRNYLHLYEAMLTSHTPEVYVPYKIGESRSEKLRDALTVILQKVAFTHLRNLVPLADRPMDTANAGEYFGDWIKKDERQHPAKEVEGFRDVITLFLTL